jgi:serine phosphatase RsbU (regulator of sigma subunit)
VGESRAGTYLGGDFFDIITLPDGKLAIALGDVTGHGVAASVLMTATQGFLHAALEQHADAARAVNLLNRFIHPRRSDEKFVTLWVGIFDLANKTLQYVDGGHGYAQMLRADGTFEALDGGDGLPVGVFDGIEYSSVETALGPGDRMLVVSDGIVEQFGPVQKPDGTTALDHFNLEGVEKTIRALSPADDIVARLFEAVVKHAHSPTLQDDATAVLVSW